MVLDCDTGTDDAVAIMLTGLRPELDLVAVTTVWGNCPVEDTAANSLSALEVIARGDVPVLAGLGGPLGTEPRHVEAVDWLVETARSATQQFTLVCTGPLSNIAAALLAQPALTETVDEVVVMGGSLDASAGLPESETNAGHDPAACAAVLSARFERLVLVPLDATHQAPIAYEHCAALRDLGTTAGAAAADLIEQRIAGRDQAPVHDALTVAYLLDPAVLVLRPATVSVDIADIPGRTTAIFGRGAGAVQVAVGADQARFFDLLLDSFSR